MKIDVKLSAEVLAEGIMAMDYLDHEIFLRHLERNCTKAKTYNMFKTWVENSLFSDSLDLDRRYTEFACGHWAKEVSNLKDDKDEPHQKV